MIELPSKAKPAIIWAAIEVLLRQGGQFIIMIVLARLLTPEDFGIIAILVFFIMMANILVDFGLSSALIQRQNNTKEDESSLFIFHILFSIFIVLVLLFFASSIASFFNVPILEYLLYVASFSVFFHALSLIHIALLTKHLEFKLIAKAGGVASLLSGLVAIFLALIDFGVWSLVAMLLISNVIIATLLWRWNSWRPILKFKFSAIKPYFEFARYILLTDFLNTFYLNVHALLIGKVYSLHEAGIYDRGQKTYMLPANFIMAIINKVAYPIFSATINDVEKLKKVFIRAIGIAMFISMPIFLTLSILSEPVILLIFGDKWLESAPILQVLCLSGILIPLNLLNLNLLKAWGRSDLFFKLITIRTVIALFILFIAINYSVMAVVWAQLLISLISFLFNSYYTNKVINYSPFEQLKDLLPYFFVALTTTFLSWIIYYFFIEMHYLLMIVIVLCLYSLFYILFSYFLNLLALKEIVLAVRSKNVN